MTLGVALIVKNEEKIIERCLSSVKGIVDKIIICDTGSTDNTIEIIKNFANINKIDCEIYSKEWKNFGWNRTELLKIAKNKTDYLLLLDADELPIISKEFNKEILTTDAYYLHYDGSLDYAQILLINNRIDWYYVGVTHEYIDTKSKITEGTLNTITMHSFDDGKNRENKSQRDIELLQQGIKEEPNSTRYHFYLAQTYKDTGKYEEAIEYYLKRIKMGGWEEEVYYSMYASAYCQEELGNIELAKSGYLAAWEFRPIRSEALYRIARLCRCRGEYQQGYMFAKRGLEIPYPKDKLFINKDIYDYDLLFEKSICSYYVGEYQESYNECKKLLTQPNIPEHLRFQSRINIQFSEQKIFGKIMTNIINQEDALENLKDIYSVCNELNIPVFPFAGTLLGIIRENKFIIHDEDIDMALKVNDYSPQLIEKLIDNGFEFENSYGKIELGYEFRFRKRNIQIDFFIFYDKENYTCTYCYDTYGKLYELKYEKFELKEFNFKNIKIKVPNNPEEFLRQQYGVDWRIPKKEWDYLTDPENIKSTLDFAKLSESDKIKQVIEIKELELLFKQQFNLQLYPIYGTLLGIVRDNDFISHDDDLDLAYISKYHTKKKILQELDQICKKLTSLGLLVKRFGFNGQLHVMSPSKKQKIDIWTSWTEDGKYYLTYTIDGEIKEDQVLPLKSITFKNQELLIPQQPESIFEVLYHTWKTPLKDNFAKAKWVFKLYEEK